MVTELRSPSRLMAPKRQSKARRLAIGEIRASVRRVAAGVSDGLCRVWDNFTIVLGHSTSPAARGEAAVDDLEDGVFPKAQREIGVALGVTAVVEAPTWSEHLYSCRYTYPDGYFTLSVKELSSWTQTFSYFRGIGSSPR